MPKLPRLTATEAEALLLKAGFVWLRSKGSHRIYRKAARRVVVPFHAGAALHPKIARQTPKLLTFGASEDECLRSALDALETAFIALISDRTAIPKPSPIRRGTNFVTLPVLAAAKFSLYQEMLARDMRKAELARRLGWHKPQIDRLLDLRHDSRLDQMEQAFAALGKRVRIAKDAA
jgi:antitoxin HicB